MTVIIILLSLISLFSVTGLIGYLLVFGRKLFPELKLNEEVTRNLSNASLMLAMVLFLGLVFYIPVAFPIDKSKPSAKVEGNITLSPEQIKYQKKYNMESFGVVKISGTITYPIKEKDPTDHLIKLKKGEEGLKISDPLPYDEVWMNTAAKYKVFWNKGAFVVEIGYFDEKNPQWIMDRETFLALKEEPF